MNHPTPAAIEISRTSVLACIGIAQLVLAEGPKEKKRKGRGFVTSTSCGKASSFSQIAATCAWRPFSFDSSRKALTWSSPPRVLDAYATCEIQIEHAAVVHSVQAASMPPSQRKPVLDTKSWEQAQDRPADNSASTVLNAVTALRLSARG